MRSIQKEEDGNEEVSWLDDGFRFNPVEKEEDENEEVSGFDDSLGLVLLTGVAFTADTHTVTVTANVVATWRFNWATPTLGFGALDPGVGGDVNASTSTTSWCTKNASHSITDDDGLYVTGRNTNRMPHAATRNLIGLFLFFEAIQGSWIYPKDF